MLPDDGQDGSIGRDSALRSALEGARIVGGDMTSLPPVALTTSLDGCWKLVDFTLDRLGEIDVLFNNAALACLGWIGEISEADFAGRSARR